MLKEIKNATQHFFVDENGLTQGEYKELHSDSDQLWEHCIYVNGDRHGEFKLWYANGQQCVDSFYIDGKRNGEYKSWHQNGKLSKHFFYVDDNMHGEYREWDENSTLIDHCEYQNGVRKH